MSLALILSSSCATSQSQKNGWWIPAPSVAEALGDNTANVVFSPDSVIHYNLGAPNSNPQPLQGFFRQDDGRALTPAEICTLQFLLPGNPDNYSFETDTRPAAPFFPYDEFLFVKGGEKVSILVSSSDMTWVIAINGEKVELYDYREWKTMERFLKQFLQ